MYLSQFLALLPSLCLQRPRAVYGHPPSRPSLGRAHTGLSPYVRDPTYIQLRLIACLPKAISVCTQAGTDRGSAGGLAPPGRFAWGAHTKNGHVCKGNRCASAVTSTSLKRDASEYK
jgi:hypothetical protein